MPDFLEKNKTEKRFVSGLNEGELVIIKGAIINYLQERGLVFNPNVVTAQSIDERIFDGVESGSIASNELLDLPALGQKLAKDFEPKEGIEADM